MQSFKRYHKHSKRFSISNNRSSYKSSKVDPYVRKIDLIVAGKKMQLATNEWKKSDYTNQIALKQQSKNVRMNKTVLKSLEDIHVQDENKKYIFSLTMDWRGTVIYLFIYASCPLLTICILYFKGNSGYLFYVAQLDDVYLAKYIHTLSVPKSLNESTTRYYDLNALYVWKHHQQRFVNIIESSLE